MTPRDLVNATLDFTPGLRVPRQLWVLPGAAWEHPEFLRRLEAEFPADITGVGGHCREQAPTSGDPHRRGTHVDAWGCTFINVHDGIIGEVKEPQVRDWAADAHRVHIPREWLSIDRDAVNRDCAVTDRFVQAGCCPRPFEQLQFIRGTPELLMDLADPPPELLAARARPSWHRLPTRATGSRPAKVGRGSSTEERPMSLPAIFRQHLHGFSFAVGNHRPETVRVGWRLVYRGCACGRVFSGSRVAVPPLMRVLMWADRRPG